MSYKTMTTALTVTLTFLAPVSAGAEITDFEAEICDTWVVLAEEIMTERQAGGSMPQAIKKADEQEMEVHQFAYRDFVMEAYSRPRFNTSENQQDSVTDFVNDIFLECRQIMDRD